MKPVRVYVDGVALRGPGIEDWPALCGLFEGADYSPAYDDPIVPQCLSPRAARRLSPQISLALAIAERLAPSLADDASWVFASSVGEGETLQVILESLRQPAMLVQPLRFQNSVHNAAAGQWSIAAGITRPFTSVAAHDETVGAGFLKASAQMLAEGQPIGLVFYDVPTPEPLNAKRPLGISLGIGLALSPNASPATLVSIDLTIANDPATPPESAVSRRLLESGNPVAGALPLLERIAGRATGTLHIGVHGGRSLALAVEPVE